MNRLRGSCWEQGIGNREQWTRIDANTISPVLVNFCLLPVASCLARSAILLANSADGLTIL
ncbi:MAG: hypothetical protein F6K65_27990 [Moorea sp. SIO3C2]|nr:hypothetical protein [Moorena sp. SIO3C2]